MPTLLHFRKNAADAWFHSACSCVQTIPSNVDVAEADKRTRSLLLDQPQAKGGQQLVLLPYGQAYTGPDNGQWPIGAGTVGRPIVRVIEWNPAGVYCDGCQQENRWTDDMHSLDLKKTRLN